MTVTTALLLVLLFWLACAAAVIVMFVRGKKYSPYPPEAAEAPDVAEEVYAENGDTFGYERSRLLDEVGPAIVAGSDLDRAHQPMSLVNLTLSLMVEADPDLSAMRDRAETLAGLYVTPEVER